MRPGMRAIDINACARKVEVDNRIPLHYYYRIAENLLKQASIYRQEKNLIELYITLLRFSSLMCDTIPSHRDYQVLLPKEKVAFRKKLLGVIDELETLKPNAQRQVDELNKGHIFQFDNQRSIFYDSSPFSERKFSSNPRTEQSTDRSTSLSPRMHDREHTQDASSGYLQIDKQLHKLSRNLPQPKEETLSRHSILGPNGLQGQWPGPIISTRVQYPSNIDSTRAEIVSPNQDGSITVRDGGSKPNDSDMESILSLDDGRWSIPSPSTAVIQEDFLRLRIRQPSPPPVLAEVHEEFHTIPPSKVADPRPGPAKLSGNGVSNSKTYQDVHIPVKMLENFLKLAEMNTVKNMETCGVLAGSLKNSMFYIKTLIIPKQESTSDSCQTTNEEEIFNVQDNLSLFPLGWIHTHPTQTCFMSSIDLHTHYSYQIMLPEAIAIVMAPTDTSRKHGIFHLSDPSGVSVIRNCQERGFHPHEEPVDGSPIYEHCSHVYMNPSMKFDVIDLRNS